MNLKNLPKVWLVTANDDVAGGDDHWIIYTNPGQELSSEEEDEFLDGAERYVHENPDRFREISIRRLLRIATNVAALPLKGERGYGGGQTKDYMQGLIAEARKELEGYGDVSDGTAER